MAIVSIMSIVILTAASRDVAALSGVRSVVVGVVSPIGRVLGAVFSPVGRVWNGVANYDDVSKENEALREENDQLRSEAAQSTDAAQRLAELEKLLDLGFADDLDRVAAQVVARGVSNLDQYTVQIDKGSDAGIQNGMAVVTAAGLVGRVVDTTESRSFVELITDPTMRVGVRLDTSRDLAVGRGSGPGRPFIVDEGLERSELVKDGETVSTSGLDRALFPAGIPVGTVSKVDEASDVAGPIVEVDLLADSTRLDIVQVLRWLPTD